MTCSKTYIREEDLLGPCLLYAVFLPFPTVHERSEGFNIVLKRYVNPSNSILEFAKQYMALQHKILWAKSEAEANTSLTMPKFLMLKTFEKQMARAYT